MSFGADNITLNCLIVPCGQLHTLPRDRVVQRVTAGKSQGVSALESTIQSNLGAPFNNIRLNIRQVYPNDCLKPIHRLLPPLLLQKLEMRQSRW
jgi:hypothetical protein